MSPDGNIPDPTRDDVKEVHPIPESIHGASDVEGQTSQSQPPDGPTPLPPTQFTDSPDARSKSITTAQGPDTHGALNQLLSDNVFFQVGVHDDRGQRRTMEDAYSFVVDFARVRGQGYFAVFDGHAGKYAAEWCGQHFHDYLLEQLRNQPDLPIPDILNHTFHAVDTSLSELASKDNKMHSGCTAVTAFLRIEDQQGKQSFLQGLDIGGSKSGETASPTADALSSGSGSSKPTDTPNSSDIQAYPTPESSQTSNVSPSESPRSESPASGKTRKSGILKKGSQVVSALKSLASPSSSSVEKQQANDDLSNSSQPLLGPVGEAVTPPTDANLRRVLYIANAGDARAVLCRGGRAVRLTYDHKGTDKQEVKRIMDAGGFVVSGRVHGVLAVTRALGDSSFKEFVVGSPYTTETELGDEDEFLILACDGLWDVASDQQACDLIRNIQDPQAASRALVEHALQESTDNITAIVVRFPSSNKPISSTSLNNVHSYTNSIGQQNSGEVGV